LSHVPPHAAGHASAAYAPPGGAGSSR
jgi:hypothetical protein